MHLVILVPCHDEASTVGAVLDTLPKSLPGISAITRVVVDDGSSDDTASVALNAGADLVISMPRQGGVASAFVVGLERAVALGADIIVNLDGDGQHPGDRVGDLIAPIIRGEAQMMVGIRDRASIQQFHPVKRALERLGSRIARRLSGTDISDGPSGFRAMTREVAMRLHVFNRYSYTLETLIQAGRSGIAIGSIEYHSPIAERPSRVVRSVWGYVARQSLTMVRVSMAYRPFRFFALPGLLALGGSGILGARHLILYAITGQAGRVQSLLLAAVLAGVGVALIVVGLLADLVAVNRRLLEDIDWRLKRLEYDGQEKA